MSKQKNSIGDIVDNIYYDEEVSEARITKGDIKIIIKAFHRQSLKMLKDNGEFNFYGFFKIKLKKMNGWTTKNITDDEVEVKPFYRTYLSLSKSAKDYLNEK